MENSKKIYHIPNVLCRNTLAGHMAPVEAVLVRDKYIISSSRLGTIFVWDLYSGKKIKTLEGHSKSVTTLDYENGILVSGSNDTTIRLWSLNTGECFRILQGHTEAVLAVSISKDIIASGSDDTTIRIWNAQNGELIRVLDEHERSVSTVKIFGETLYSGSWDHFLRIWDLKTGECKGSYEEHFDSIMDLDVNKNVIVTADYTGYINVWNRKTHELIHHLKQHRLAVLGIKIDNNYIYSTSKDKSIRITDINTGVCVKKLEGHQDATTGIDKQANFIITSSADKLIKIWDDFSLHSRHTIKAHENQVLGTKNEGNLLVTAGTDNFLKIWNIEEGTLYKTIKINHIGWIWGLDFKDNRILASSDDGFYRLYDVDSGQMLQELKGHEGKVYRTMIHGNKAITSGWDNTARVWDLNSGVCLHVLRGHSYAVYSSVITEDGKYITGSSDGTIRVWDSNGSEIRMINFHQDEIFHIDVQGDLVASASGDGVCGVFNYHTGELVASFDDHSDQVWTVLFHGDIIITGSADNTIKIWDINTKSCLDTLEGHNDAVKDLAISGNYLVSGSFDSTIKIWDIKKYLDTEKELEEKVTKEIESLTAQIQMARTYDLIPAELGEPGLIRILYSMNLSDSDKEFKNEKFIASIKESAKTWNNVGRIGYAPWLSVIPRGIKAGTIPLEEDENVANILQEFLSGFRENKDLYWLGLLRRYQNNLEQLLPSEWTFKLHFSGQGPNPIDGYEWIPLRSKINYTSLEDREETALVFQITLQNINEWLLPIIKAIEIQLKDDRGDVKYIQFNNFIPNEEGDWTTTAMFKIDSGYRMEPTAIIHITDIRVIYDENLTPSFQGSNIVRQLNEIRLENQELENYLEVLHQNIQLLNEEIASISLENPPTKKPHKKTAVTVQKGYRLDELANSSESMEVFKYVKKKYQEPKIGNLEVKIKEYFNKFLEFIQPKFILFTSATSIVSAILSILVYLHVLFPDQVFMGEKVLGSDFTLLEIMLYASAYVILAIILVISIATWFRYQFRKRK
ncbi:MAG: WD40 repeat domain-containing protein [Promethearchaeota archaeon]